MKLLQLALGTVIGLLLGGGLGVYVGKELRSNGYFEEVPEFYQAKHDIKLENNSVIARGTQLRFDRSTPEGFTRLILTINTEDFEAFSKIDGEHSNEIRPYWTIGDAQPESGQPASRTESK